MATTGNNTTTDASVDEVAGADKADSSTSVIHWWKFSAGFGIVLSLIFTALTITLIAVGIRVTRETDQRLIEIENQINQLRKSNLSVVENQLNELNMSFIEYKEMQTIEDSILAAEEQTAIDQSNQVNQLEESQQNIENLLEIEIQDLNEINRTIKALEDKERILDDIPVLQNQLVGLNQTLIKGQQNQLTINEQAAKEDQVEKLNKTLISLQQQLRLIEDCSNGLIYENVCFKLAYNQGPGVNITDAESICQSIGSNLAEISSDAMYMKVYQYVAQTWIEYTDKDVSYVDVWLGSTFQPINNTNQLVTLTNGTTINLKEWSQNFPNTGPDFAQYKSMAIVIRNVAVTSSDVGLINNLPSSKLSVPLCSLKTV